MVPPPSGELAIEFDHASFQLNGRTLLHDLVLSVKQGETLVLLGRSGSGKTTSLKLINRLLLPTTGEVRVNGRRTAEWDPIRLRRSIGYVIQDGGLFPHFTVERNIALVPRIENWPKERVDARVRELLSLVGLSAELASRYPSQLSGGQRQRVGVARALAADPANSDSRRAFRRARSHHAIGDAERISRSAASDAEGSDFCHSRFARGFAAWRSYRADGGRSPHRGPSCGGMFAFAASTGACIRGSVFRNRGSVAEFQ